MAVFRVIQGGIKFLLLKLFLEDLNDLRFDGAVSGNGFSYSNQTVAVFEWFLHRPDGKQLLSWFQIMGVFFRIAALVLTASLVTWNKLKVQNSLEDNSNHKHGLREAAGAAYPS